MVERRWSCAVEVEVEDERREVRDLERLVRRVDWAVVVVSLVCRGDGEWEGVDEVELASEGVRVSRGEVCVAMSLWKSSVGPESIDSTSDSLS